MNIHLKKIKFCQPKVDAFFHEYTKYFEKQNSILKGINFVPADR